MLRKARFLFRSVPSATLWKEKQARDWAKSPGLSGKRQVRLLDSLTQTPTRAVLSPGRGYSGKNIPGTEMIFAGTQKAERADLVAYLLMSTSAALLTAKQMSRGS